MDVGPSRFRRSAVLLLALGLLLGFLIRLTVAVLDGEVLEDEVMASRFIGACLAVAAVSWLEWGPPQMRLQDTVLAPRYALRDVLIGVVAGTMLMCSVVGAMWMAGWYTAVPAAWNPAELGARLLLLLIAALFEELLFRGLLFRRLEAFAGSWLALLLSAALFGLPHLANAGATVGSTLALALGGGVMLGAACMARGTLWLAVGMHWAWNCVQGPVFALPVSGIEGAALLQARVEGPTVWTGGVFGVEGGLFVVLLPGLACFVLLREAIKRGRVVPPPWGRRA